MPEAIKYLISGTVNTIIGYSTFLLLYKFFNIIPAVANAISYAIALFAAFLLSRHFVFGAKTKNRAKGQVYRFILSFLISFTLNQFILYILFRLFQIKAEYAQIASMIVYTITFYALSKNFVFAPIKS